MRPLLSAAGLWLRDLVASPAPSDLPKRHEHRDIAAVAYITLAEQPDQVAFLEQNSDQDIAGRHDREQQMADRHHRRAPEGDHETEIDWMTHQLVEPWGAQLRCCAIPRRREYLT